MKKTAVIFSVLAFSIASFGISSVHAAGSAVLSLSPSNTSVSTGGNFSLSVQVDPKGESLDTARVELDFDAAKLEVLSVERGSLFPNESPANTTDNSSGNVSYGVFKFGDPVTEAGTLATVTFRALASGESTISVLDTSKLIADGSEKMDMAALGTSVITISGDSVEPTTTSEQVSSDSSETSLLEEQALVYYGALKGDLPSSESEWNALHCIAYGGCTPDQGSLEKEQEALDLFTGTYASLPSTSMEWNVIHAIAYTNTFINWGDSEAKADVPVAEEVVVEEAPSEEETASEEEAPASAEETAAAEDTSSDSSLEQEGLIYFGAFFGRMPSSANDWEALHCMAYGGCQGDPRDLAAEEAALVTFGAKYGKMPETQVEWNVLHTLAYTDLMLAN